MDFESLLFGLQKLIHAPSVAEIVNQGNAVEEYIKMLDQLAVHLRSPANRDIVRESGLFQRLLSVLEMLLDSGDSNGEKKVLKVNLSSELMRCIANCLADNDINRRALVGESIYSNRFLTVQVPGILFSHGLTEIEKTLKARTVVMIRNLCLGNEEYTADCATYIPNSLFALLEEQYPKSFDEESLEEVIMPLDLLTELIKFSYQRVSVIQFAFLVELLKHISVSFEPAPQDNTNNNNTEGNQNEEVEEDDAFSDAVLLLTEIIEIIVSQNQKLDFSDSNCTTHLEKILFSILEQLEPIEYLQNKLIILRRLSSTLGHISANITAANIEIRDSCISVIKNSSSSYSIAAAFIALSNSISSRKDADDISKSITLDQIIGASKKLRDPMQFQGFLDLTKKLLNASNAIELQEQDALALFSVLKMCQDQCKYYQNLTPLVGAALRKLIAVFPGSMLRKAYEFDLKSIVLDHGGIAVCLLIDKLSLQKNVSNVTFEELWSTAFKFKDSSVTSQGVSSEFLFQFTKSLGLYLRPLKDGEYNIVFAKHSSELNTLLETVLQLRNKSDTASQSIWNNGRFVAGMIINLQKGQHLTAVESKLQDVAKQFFEQD